MNIRIGFGVDVHRLEKGYDLFIGGKQISLLSAFGVAAGETVRSEFGAYLTTKYKKNLMENT